MPYYIYVINLIEEVLTIKKFRDANPNYIEGKACYYVGSTGKSPRERSEEHRLGFTKEGKKARKNNYAHKFHNGLTQRYASKNPLKTREEAESMEAYVAERLRSKGFAVWSQ